MVKEKEEKIDPIYLTRNKLWDSDWLMNKYPDRYNDLYDMDDEMLNTVDEQFRLMYGYRGKL